MNNIIEFDFSEISLIGLTLLTFTVAVLFKLINLIVIRKSNKPFIKNIYLLFEVAFWFSFMIWAVNILLKDSIYKMIAVLSLAVLLVAVLGWFISRDLIAGIVIRFTDNFKPGQNINIDSLSGVVKDIGLLSITVQQGGITHRIPWTKFSGQIYSKGNADGAVRQSFTIKADRKQNLEKIHQKIREAILLSSGSDINKEPQIKLTETHEEYWLFDITMFTLKTEYDSGIKANIDKAILNL